MAGEYFGGGFFFLGGERGGGRWVEGLRGCGFVGGRMVGGRWGGSGKRLCGFEMC